MGHGVLGPIGISEEEERSYEALLRRPRMTRTELAAATGTDPKQTSRILRLLEAKGLVGRAPEAPSLYQPVRPDIAIEALVLGRQEELTRVRSAASALLERFRSSAVGASGGPVDILSGPPELILQRWENVQKSATAEVLIFDKPPYVRAPTSPNPVELGLLERGIKYRVLYDETSFAVPGKLDAARGCVRAGEEAKVFAGIPLKLIIADDRLGLTHDVREGIIQDVVTVYPSGLLDGLTFLFETLWRQAVPFPFERARTEPNLPPSWDALDLQILALLAAGSKDEAIARQLALGLRTVRRRAAGIMAALGVRTRFQAGVRAEQRGFLALEPTAAESGN